MTALLMLMFLFILYYNVIPYFRYLVDRYIFTKIIDPNSKRWVFVQLHEEKEVYIGYILKKIDDTKKYIVRLYTNTEIKNILILKENIIELEYDLY